MITGISAVTLATHDMARAVRFIAHSASSCSMWCGREFQQFPRGARILHPIVQPAGRFGHGWGRAIFYDDGLFPARLCWLSAGAPPRNAEWGGRSLQRLRPIPRCGAAPPAEIRPRRAGHRGRRHRRRKNRAAPP